MLVVTPNVCLDVTTWLPTLTPGSVLRASRAVTSAGGKGVNVCRTLRLMEEFPTLVGLAAADDDRLSRFLQAEDCRFRPVKHVGDTRLAQIILEQDNGRATVINGRGPELSETEWDEFVQAVRECTPTRSVVVCSGSLPPGVPVSAYGQITDIAHEAGSLALIDGQPAVLGAALARQPDLVSPNLAEAEGLLHGLGPESVDDHGDDPAERCVDASQELHHRGARRAVVTGGRWGAALTNSAGSWWFPAPQVAVVSPIGAGDAFLGGVAHALNHGSDDCDAVSLGMSVAAAACETETAGIFVPSRAHELRLTDPRSIRQ